MKFIRCIFGILITTTLIFYGSLVFADVLTFSDIPEAHWAFDDIHTLRQYGITNGIGGNEFGIGRTLTRAEFITFLSSLMQWEVNKTTELKWYTPYINAAAQQGIITEEEIINFHSEDNITREEMALFIIRSLGYETLAYQLESLSNPFSDVSKNIGHIQIAKDFGIIAGISDTQFAPNISATREQAAAMIARLFRKLYEFKYKDWNINGFYAISSSGQSNLISLMDTVSFGWCKLEPSESGVALNFTNKNSNEYFRPEGYEEVLIRAKSQGKKTFLMIPIKGNAADLLTETYLRNAAVFEIENNINDYDGVVIDFENLRANSQENFCIFLRELNIVLDKKQKELVVAVQPARGFGQAFFDGYNFKTIGEIADKIILMAHDYYPKILTEEEMAMGFTVTPLSPINEVYYSLLAMIESGVDRSKVALQFSFDTAQWKTSGGKIIHNKPYSPSYNAVWERINNGAIQQYSKKYENPYITFFSSEDGAENIVWYENQRSINEKMRLCSLFGFSQISLWRIGLIPDDVISLFN